MHGKEERKRELFTLRGRRKLRKKKKARNLEKSGEKLCLILLTNQSQNDILSKRQVGNAGVAQLVEQLICNQQVGGSSPSTSSKLAQARHGLER